MKPEVIVAIPYGKLPLEHLRQDFEVRYAPTPEGLATALEQHGQTARAMITSGVVGAPQDILDRLPNLEIIHTAGVGYESVDLPTVKKRGIVVATGKGTNAFAVADHAMALTLAITRNIVLSYEAVKQGQWQEARIRCESVWKRRMGILGMGDIGAMIAQRAIGFDMSVAYHSRSQKPDLPYTFQETPLALARVSDVVVIALPGGPETRHMVNAEFLEALGPNGFLINVGRGSIVDTQALVAALNEKQIAGAALDVVEGEPDLAPELFTTPNLIITPHLAGRSRQSAIESTNRVHQNLKAHFGGLPLVSRVV
jgi:D-3-phosphoglycerate dehydrogenase